MLGVYLAKNFANSGLSALVFCTITDGQKWLDEEAFLISQIEDESFILGIPFFGVGKFTRIKPFSPRPTPEA